MTKIRIVIFFCLLSSLCSCKVEVEDPSALKAGIIPISYLTYHRFGPDTIYRADRKIDFTNDSIPDLLFSSGESEHVGSESRGYMCGAEIGLIDSSFSIAAFKLWSTHLIHQGDCIDSTLSWTVWQSYGVILTLNDIIVSRGHFLKYYIDSTGYIGLKYKEKLGWLKIKVEGCSKIILYEYLIK